MRKLYRRADINTQEQAEMKEKKTCVREVTQAIKVVSGTIAYGVMILSQRIIPVLNETVCDLLPENANN